MLLILGLLAVFCLCYNNGVGKVPAMGWNSWNQFGCGINETIILETMHGFQKYGLRDVGYQYINVDDCWQLQDRDTSGKIVPDPNRFPDMKSLAEKVHGAGFKFGLYTDIGEFTCQKRAGSYGHYDIDAATYKEWNIDYIKVDFCYTTKEEQNEPWKYYTQFSNAINQTNHSMLFSLCNWGVKDPWKWAGKIGHSWRTTGDISSSFQRVLEIVEQNEPLHPYARPYEFNDPDMLEVGVVRKSELSYEENRSHFSLWCIMAAPLILGIDLTKEVPETVLDIITNQEVISVNQDVLGQQGFIIKQSKIGINATNYCDQSQCTWTQIWKKELDAGKIAVLLFNHASQYESSSSKFAKGEEITIDWSDLGVSSSKKFDVRDLWAKKDLGVFVGSFSTPSTVSQHDVMMILLTPA